MLRFGFLAILCVFAAVIYFTSGAGREEVQFVRNAEIRAVRYSGIQSTQSVDQWIEDQFYLGRFKVRWSAEDIAEGSDAGKVQVYAHLTSNSKKRLENSIVLQFVVDPQTQQVVFAGMVLEGKEMKSPSGKFSNLQAAMAKMWEIRKATYLSEENLSN